MVLYIGMSIKKITTNLLFQLIITIILCLFYRNYVGINTIRFFLTISVLLRESLIFVLPFLVFSFVAVALLQFKQNHKFLILLLVPLVFMSGFFHVFLSGILGYSMLSDIKTQETIITNEIIPFVQFELVNMNIIIIALAMGVAVGIYNSIYKHKLLETVLYGMRSLIIQFMQKFFIPLLPLFIVGFFLKLSYENQMSGFVGANMFVFLKILLALFLYYLFWIYVAVGFKVGRSLEMLKNMLPAILTGFITMSSAIALPLSLNAAEKNTRNKNLSDTIMPLTLSLHLIGDTLLVPIMCMFVLLVFNHPLPTIYNFAAFSIFFIVNQFAGAGVPNATIMLLIPVLIKYWGYNDVMIAFVIAFYAIVEPISTAGNIAANNIFVVLVHKGLLKYNLNNFLCNRFER